MRPAHARLGHVRAEVLVLDPERAVVLVRVREHLREDAPEMNRVIRRGGPPGLLACLSRPVHAELLSDHRPVHSRHSPFSSSGMRSRISLLSSNSPPVTRAYARFTTMPCGVAS